MQGHNYHEKNPQDSDRQKQEELRIETRLQNDAQNKKMQNNPLRVSKKKEITDQSTKSQETQRKTQHHDQQDNEEEDESQGVSKPLKKLHTEASEETSQIEISSKNSQDETTEKIDLDKVYASFEKLTSFKNTLEHIHPKNGLVDPNIPKYQPEHFKIPPQDLKNIEDFILSYPTEILANFQGFYSIKTESEDESNSNTESDSDDDDILSDSSAYILGRCSSEVPPEF